MSSKSILAQAEIAHQQGQLVQAQALYQQALNQHPTSDALYGLATLYHQQGNYDSAKPLFVEALSQEPNAFDISYNYLLCLLASKDLEKAKDLVEKTIALAPTDKQLRNQLAQFALQLGLPELCLRISPNETPQGQLTRSNAYVQLGQWLDGYNEVKPLYKRFPQEPQVLQTLAMCAAKIDKFDEAIDAFQILVDKQPDNSKLRIKFADLFLMAKKLTNAREHLTKAISLNDMSITRYEVECKVCRLENNKAEAIAAANKAIEIQPSAEFAWQVLHDFGTPEQNRQCIEQLLLHTKETSQYSYSLQHNLYTLAKAQQKDGQYNAAFQSFNKANNLQAQQFKADSNQYSPELQLQTFDRIQSINYPACQLKSTKTYQFFVVGMPRSGTTLVNRVLSQMQDVESFGESNGIATLFENKLYDKSASENDIAQWLTDNAEQHVAFYKSFNKQTVQKSVDKMPHNFRYVGAILSTFPNVKVIQMRRRADDLALSIYSQFFNQQHNYSCNLSDIAHAIHYANKLMDFWAKTFPAQVIDVNYEDLAQSPEDSFSSLFNKLGLSWQPQYLEFHRENVASYTFSETQVRQPINKSKINFSEHYNTQMKLFRDTYSQLIQSH